MANNVPITNGQGQSSIAAQDVGGVKFQRIEIMGDGGASVLAVNPDGSLNASIIGTPVVSLGSGNASVITVIQNSSLISITAGSVVAIPQGSVITVLQSSSILAVPVGSVITTVIGSVITVGQSSSVIAVVTGSVTQGTTPWAVTNVGSVITTNVGSVITIIPGSVITVWKSSSVIAIAAGSVVAIPQGSVITVFQSSSLIAVNAGSVVTVPTGSVITVLQSPSIVGTYAEDAAHTTADKGLFILGVRNDAVASFAGSNSEYTAFGVDSAGRALTKPFAAEESRIEGYISLTSTSVTTLVAAAGAGLRNYITDIFVANTGAATTLVTFTSGGGASVLGYTIAPTGGGSNLIGFQTPIQTLANQTFGVQAGTATSTLYVTVKGYKAP